MKKILILLLIILAIPIALASEPQYYVDTDVLEDSFINGNHLMGTLEFEWRDHIPKDQDITELSNITVQQYDILKNKLNDGITIQQYNEQSLSINIGSERKLNFPGTYDYYSTNTSDTRKIIILPADDNRIEIDNLDLPDGFDLNFTNYNFTLSKDSSVWVDLNLSIDDDISPGDYELKYDINGEENLDNIKVLKNINWTINSSLINETNEFWSGETRYLGRIMIENIGNSEIELTTTKTGNFSNFIGLPNDRTIFKKNKIQLDFEANVPNIAKAGFYTMELQFNGNDGEIFGLVPLNFTIIDSIKPTIEDITFSTDKAFVDNEINVYTSDNNEVMNVTLAIDGKTVIFDKDNELFTTTLNFDKLSKYKLNFCAIDEAKNSYCKTINKTFEQIDLVKSFKDVIKVPSVMKGKYSKVDIFNISEDLTDEEIIIRLVNIESNELGKNITEPIIRLVNDRGGIMTFSKYDSEISLTEPGKYSFEIRSDSVVDYSGLVRFILPEQVKEVKDITFTASFKDFEVPEEFEKNIGTNTIKCSPTDKGDLDESYINCNFKVPYDTRPEDISVIMTVSEKTKIEESITDAENETTSVKVKFGITMTIVVMLFIFMIIWYYYKVKMYPYMRIMTAKTKFKDKN